MPEGKPGAASRKRWGLLEERFFFVLAVFAASRLFYLLSGALFASFLPVGGFHLLTADVPFGTLSIWAHWDGVWYSEIAVIGYEERGPASAAFFPLYPLLVRAFAELFGGPLTLSAISVWGMLLSLLALPFGLYFVYRIAEDGWGPTVACRTVLIVAFFPTSFFFNAAYTESLFLALSAGSLWAMRVRKDLLLACAFAAFATATRNVGVFLLAPLAIEWFRGLERYRWQGAYLALAPSGLLAYMAYLWYQFGNPLQFQTAQEYWDRSLMSPPTFFVEVISEAYASLGELFVSNPPADSALEGLVNRLHGPNDAYNLLFLLFTIAVLVLGLRILPLSLSVYTFLLTIPTALVGTSYTPLMGFSRYTLVAFPLFITLAVLLEDRRPTRVWLAASAAFSLLLTALFVSWRFVA